MPQSKIAIHTTRPKITRILKALIQHGLDAANPGKAMEQSIFRIVNQLCVNTTEYNLSMT